jgi:hypothetical protein
MLGPAIPKNSAHFLLHWITRLKSTQSTTTTTQIHPIQLDHQSLLSSPQAQSSARAHIDQFLSQHLKFKETFLPFAKFNFSTSGGKGGQNVNKGERVFACFFLHQKFYC